MLVIAAMSYEYAFMPDALDIAEAFAADAAAGWLPGNDAWLRLSKAGAARLEGPDWPVLFLGAKYVLSQTDTSGRKLFEHIRLGHPSVIVRAFVPVYVVKVRLTAVADDTIDVLFNDAVSELPILVENCSTHCDATVTCMCLV